MTILPGVAIFNLKLVARQGWLFYHLRGGSAGVAILPFEDRGSAGVSILQLGSWLGRGVYFTI